MVLKRETYKTTGVILALNLLIVCLIGAEKMEEKICIVPIGAIELNIVENLKEDLQGVFKMEFNIGSPQELSASSYNPNRKQYYSTEILYDLRAQKLKGYERILGVVDEDLYVPSLNFVFGEADPKRGVALISTRRLRQGYYGLSENKQLLRQRILKEAVHELGHTYGLHHCFNPKCVMYFSNSLLDTDRKDFQFCRDCQRRLKKDRIDVRE